MTAPDSHRHLTEEAGQVPPHLGEGFALGFAEELSSFSSSGRAAFGEAAWSVTDQAAVPKGASERGGWVTSSLEERASREETPNRGMRRAAEKRRERALRESEKRRNVAAAEWRPVSAAIPQLVEERKRDPFAHPYLLPGYEPSEEHSLCGQIATWTHTTSGGEVHYRRGRRGCGRFGCPVDIRGKRETRWRNGWSTRQAHRIRARLGKRSIHFVLSPPNPSGEGGPCPPPRTPEEYRRLRAKAYHIARLAHVLRAVVIYHPERCVDADREGGHEGAHFHGLTDARLYRGLVAEIYERTGWVVKELGPRSTLPVALYELHHAGRYLPSLAESPRSAEKRAAELSAAEKALAEFDPSNPPYVDYGAEVALRETGEVVWKEGSGKERPRNPTLEALADRVVRLSHPASRDNMLDTDPCVTEAVTWFGKWDKAPIPDSDGILCPVCKEIVPVKEWTCSEWCGQDPPPEDEFGIGGEWRAVTHAGAPFGGEL